MSNAFAQPQWVQRLTQLFVRFLPVGFEVLDEAVERHGSWQWTALDVRRPANDPPLLITTATPTRAGLTGAKERGVTLAAWHMPASSPVHAPSDSSIRWIWLSDYRLQDPVTAERLESFFRTSTGARSAGGAATGPIGDRIAERSGAITLDQLVTLLGDEGQFRVPEGALIDESTPLSAHLDSLSFAELVFVLEHDLDVSLDYEQAFEAETFGDLVTLINEMRHDRHTRDERASRDR